MRHPKDTQQRKETLTQKGLQLHLKIIYYQRVEHNEDMERYVYQMKEG